MNSRIQSPAYLEVSPVEMVSGKAIVPSSKPETQRAILAASLGGGRSTVYNDLRCSETSTMKRACEAIGATIIEHEGYLEIHGIGDFPKALNPIIDARGSGLVFRVMTAITSFVSGVTVLTGDATLRSRIMAPLFDALTQLGARLECVGDPHKAPVANLGYGFKGGRCVLPGDISSQFVTAIMFAAPFASEPTEIVVEGRVLSGSYIRQTIDTLQNAGISVDVDPDLSRFVVHPGKFRAGEYRIAGDFTSASYLIGASALFDGTVTMENLSSRSLQGERAVLDVVKALGVEVEVDDINQRVTLTNRNAQLCGDFSFDASDSPNIVPTLAAIGAHVRGSFRVTGGSITRLHKSPRILAMITELSKLGVSIEPIYKGEVIDGFQIYGDGLGYPGGKVLDSWGDHRIFMSLFVATLRCHQANRLEGYRDVICSFADFREQFTALGVDSHEVAASEEAVFDSAS